MDLQKGLLAKLLISWDKECMRIESARTNASLKLRDAREKAQFWARQVEKLENFLAVLSEIEGKDPLPESPPAKREPTDLHQKNKAAGPRVLETEKTVLQILHEHGGPMTTHAILTEFERLGIPIGGKSPFATLITRLSRAPQLENIRPGGWRVRAAPKEIGGTSIGNQETPLAPTGETQNSNTENAV
jgi:hypothetical protein